MLYEVITDALLDRGETDELMVEPVEHIGHAGVAILGGQVDGRRVV